MKDKKQLEEMNTTIAHIAQFYPQIKNNMYTHLFVEGIS
jgi:hypothetical protein